MELGLQKKIVFLSGSAGGIGFSAAEAFLKEGATVILNGRSEERLKRAVAELSQKNDGRVFGTCGNATTTDGVRAITSGIRNTAEHIDVLVANLGSGKPEKTNQLDADEWRRFYEINVLSHITLINELREDLRRGTAQSVIFLSSIVAREKMAAPYGYAAAKSALLTLTKNLAKDWAPDGIRVNCVLPGNVYFPGGRWEELRTQDPAGVDQYIKEQVPMGRFAKPEEVADAIVFLSSARASFITGASLAVDGGQLSVF